ncbi:MAG: GxxExxY protein [Chitinophagaceae bacterium]
MEKEKQFIRLLAGKAVRREGYGKELFSLRRIERCRMYKLTEREEWLCKEIVDCAIKVHRQLGPGLLEKIYEICFCHELNKKNISFERQLDLPIKYDGIIFDEGLRMDVFVDNTVICELKAVDTVNPVWQAQVLSHLVMTGKHVGFLMNFNVDLMKNGIRRYCKE